MPQPRPFLERSLIHSYGDAVGSSFRASMRRAIVALSAFAAMTFAPTSGSATTQAAPTGGGVGVGGGVFV